MPGRIRPLLAFVVLLSLLAASAPATANRLIRLEPTGSIGGEGRLEASPELAENTRMSCNVTLLATITSIPKVAGTSFGKLTGLAIDRGGTPTHCFGNPLLGFRGFIPLTSSRTPAPSRELGSGILLYDLSRAEARAWSIVYDSFEGALPEISAINYHLEGVQFFIETELIYRECLYAGSLGDRMTVIRRVVTANEVVLSRSGLALAGGPGSCPIRAIFNMAFSVPRITIALL